MKCPSCGEAAIAGATFCEACGAEIDPVPGCESCGAPADQIDADGYCGQCGHKQPDPRDHLEIDLGALAAVTDKGRRHHNNQDACAIAVAEGHAVMVVCDGVSTTQNSEQASQAAADAALAVLVDAVGSSADVAEAMVRAAAAAQAAVLTVPGDRPEISPSCTFVAAVAPLRNQVPAPPEGHQVVLGWLGDSRAYWVGSAAEVLTRDHSWATELIASGTPPAEAHAHPRAHTITRWLGAEAPDIVPEVRTFAVPEPGMVLVCSDGLWNYAEDAAELRARPELHLGTPLARAAALTTFANESGGHDNITVVIADV